MTDDPRTGHVSTTPEAGVPVSTLPAAPMQPAAPKREDWGKVTPDESEERFLEGPRPRRFELWRLLRIMAEFIRGFRSLHFIGPCVTVFGSARFEEDNVYYDMAREMGRRLAQVGFTVMTGGGPGIMEAANRGAKDVGGHSIGCNIKLPMEQQPNPYLDRFIEFRYFFVRKVMLVKYSHAFVALPGGFGTLDEIFETAVLVQTGKIKEFPLVLMGKEYWAPLVEFIRTRLIEQRTVDPQDLDRIFITDSSDEAMMHITEAVTGRFGFTWTDGPRSQGPKPSRLLGER